MIEQESIQEFWEQLTPQQIAEHFGLTVREVEVLRKRFDIGEKPKDNSSVPPKAVRTMVSGEFRLQQNLQFD